jgi:hypothetical protein
MSEQEYSWNRGSSIEVWNFGYSLDYKYHISPLSNLPTNIGWVWALAVRIGYHVNPRINPFTTRAIASKIEGIISLLGGMLIMNFLPFILFYTAAANAPNAL